MSLGWESLNRKGCHGLRVQISPESLWWSSHIKSATAKLKHRIICNASKSRKDLLNLLSVGHWYLTSASRHRARALSTTGSKHLFCSAKVLDTVTMIDQAWWNVICNIIIPFFELWSDILVTHLLALCIAVVSKLSCRSQDIRAQQRERSRTPPRTPESRRRKVEPETPSAPRRLGGQTHTNAAEAC